MKRILVIITTAMVPYGGLASVMMNLYRNIDKERFHIDFASTNKELDGVLELELNKNASKYYSLGNRKRKLLQYVNRLSGVIREGNYDIVHINSNSATALIELLVSKKYGISKRIVHNHTSICNHKLLHRICYPFFRNVYTDAIACSKKAGDWIFPDGNYQIVNNGIDTEKYRYSSVNRVNVRKQYGVRETTVVLGHVGKIYKPKNHHFLIDIFAAYHEKNNDSKLLLVGDGVMRTEIEKKTAELGLIDSVIFAGMQREPEKYLSAMDFFVFPSLWEGMPLSVIEAQASGLLCFASDTIDEGVTVTDSVIRLSINNGVQIWTNALMNADNIDRDTNSERCIEMIRSAGYDSNANAHILEGIYENEEEN